MKPEPGDKSVLVTRGHVAEALRPAGVVPGDTVIFHSSLSSMGRVVGGADTVIEGFLDAVGPEGTVAVPTLWYHQTDPPMRFEQWDIDSSPAYVGRIPETFRQRPDSVRSDNPSHSVSAIGAQAVELTRDHGAWGLRPSPWGRKAFARASPWQKLYEWNAAYCFIGVDLTINTMRHFMEALLVVRVLGKAPPLKRAALEARVVDWEKPGVWPHHSSRAMGEVFAEKGLVRFGKIGSATLRCIRAREMVDCAASLFECDPEKWFKKDFLEWLRDAAPHDKANRRKDGEAEMD